jgi:hypothetical protein
VPSYCYQKIQKLDDFLEKIILLASSDLLEMLIACMLVFAQKKVHDNPSLHN